MLQKDDPMNAAAKLQANICAKSAVHVVRREIIAEDPEAMYSYVEDDGRLYHAVERLMEGKSVCICPREDDWADLSDSETPFSLGARQTYRDSLEELVDRHIAELVTFRDKLRQTRSPDRHPEPPSPPRSV